MKRLLTFITFLATLLFAPGCATSNYSYGRDFDSKNVALISKGKTTSAEVIALFGQPFSKQVINETEEHWNYIFSTGTAKAQSYIITTKVESTVQQKTLDVLLKNGIVTNYTFTDGTSPSSTNSEPGK